MPSHSFHPFFSFYALFFASHSPNISQICIAHTDTHTHTHTHTQTHTHTHTHTHTPFTHLLAGDYMHFQCHVLLPTLYPLTISCLLPKLLCYLCVIQCLICWFFVEMIIFFTHNQHISPTFLLSPCSPW